MLLRFVKFGGTVTTGTLSWSSQPCAQVDLASSNAHLLASPLCGGEYIYSGQGTGWTLIATPSCLAGILPIDRTKGTLSL